MIGTDSRYFCTETSLDLFLTQSTLYIKHRPKTSVHVQVFTLQATLQLLPRKAKHLKTRPLEVHQEEEHLEEQEELEMTTSILQFRPR